MLAEAVALTQELGRWDTFEGVQMRASLALAHWDQGRVAECRALIEPLLDLAEPPSDLPDGTRFEVLSAIGFVLTESGEPGAGEARLREALELVPTLADQGRYRVRSTRLALAAALLRQGRYDDATALVEPLCSELAPLLPHGNTVALDAFNVRGKLRLEQGRLAESLDDFESVLDAAEANLGERHPRSMNFYNNLATCHIALKHWSEAEDLLRHVIEVSTETLGADSRETLTALSNLGSVLIGSGRHDEAEEVLRSALEQELASQGENGMRTAMAHSNLAICLYHQKRFAEAAALQARALASVAPETAEYPLMERSLTLYRKLAAEN
jgi:tetratricopeptide (TPR) repeat protein